MLDHTEDTVRGYWMVLGMMLFLCFHHYNIESWHPRRHTRSYIWCRMRISYAVVFLLRVHLILILFLFLFLLLSEGWHCSVAIRFGSLGMGAKCYVHHHNFFSYRVSWHAVRFASSPYRNRRGSWSVGVFGVFDPIGQMVVRVLET